MLEKVKSVKGELRVPSDKSISHRAVILNSLGRGEAKIKNWLISEDTKATLEIYKALGIKIDINKNELIIKGSKEDFKETDIFLDAKNSGTTARLTIGVLSSMPIFAILTGDDSLKNRPMLRVVRPLREMGANILGREKGNFLPIAIQGEVLRGISFYNEKASAQVKSALIIASLSLEEGFTEIKEHILSRDHTERMLKAMGAKIEYLSTDKDHIIKVFPSNELSKIDINCPADPSSAAFFAALTILTDNSELLLKEVLVNPTRDGFFRKLKEMGASVEYLNKRIEGNEEICDILVKSSKYLKSIEVSEIEVPSLIDEIPILSILMAKAEGISIVKGAKELRVKESDRIKAIVENLKAIGVSHVEEFEDGFAIKGPNEFKPATIKTYKDHRIAMAFSIAAISSNLYGFELDDYDCVKVSYPTFFDDIKKIKV